MKLERILLGRRLVRAALAASLLCPLAIQAQQDHQAVVVTQDSAALEIGQAFLTHYGGHCLAVMPAHVAHEARLPALLREGTPPLLGEAHKPTDLGDDLAVAVVEGAVTSRCGPGALTIRRSIDTLLAQGRLGTLRSINGDGTVAHLAVTIVDDDGRQFLRIQPTHEASPIRKGHSGSRLMIEGVPVGMLLSVSARTGIGTVLRIDQLMAKVDVYLMKGALASGRPAPDSPSTLHSSGVAVAAPHDEAKSPAPQAPAKSSPEQHNGPSVIAWSALPVGNGNRAANLVALDDSAPWISEPGHWPVTLDFQLGSGLSVVNAVELDGAGLAAGELPANVEVSVNPSGNPSGWRSILYKTLVFNNGKARIEFAPMRARALRLGFGAPANGGGTITLRRVSILTD